MEHITVAGHPEPVPVSPRAVELLHDRLESARAKAGPDGAAEVAAYEARIGERIGTLLEDGMPSIDLATMRAIADFVNTPELPETPVSGFSRLLRGISEAMPSRKVREEDWNG